MQGFRGRQKSRRVGRDGGHVQFITQHFSQILSHLLLLRDAAVILNGQNHWIPEERSSARHIYRSIVSLKTYNAIKLSTFNWSKWLIQKSSEHIILSNIKLNNSYLAVSYPRCTNNNSGGYFKSYFVLYLWNAQTMFGTRNLDS